MLLLIMRHVLAQSRFLWDCLMVSNTQTHTLTHLLILFIKIIQFQTIHCIENSLFQLPIPNYSSSLHFNLVNSLSQLLFNPIYYIKQVTYNVPVEEGKGWKKLRKFYTKFDVKNRLIICCAKQVYFFWINQSHLTSVFSSFRCNTFDRKWWFGYNTHTCCWQKLLLYQLRHSHCPPSLFKTVTNSFLARF